jgi:hypothetical protein
MQTHVYVATFVVQPKIEMDPPQVPSHFRWDGPPAMGPILKASTDQVLAGQSVTPKFKLRNASSIFAADVSVEWSAPSFDAAQLLQSSAQLQRFVRNITDSHFDFLVPTNAPAPNNVFTITYGSLPRWTLSVPFLNRTVETWIPFEVWSRGLLQILSRLPDQPGTDAFDVEFRATVSWNIPDRGKPQSFAVIAHVRNTKHVGDTAIMDADVNFQIKPLQGQVS